MEFMSVIGQVGIFMICARAILHFRPKAVYEKYLRLLVSAMILVLLFQPFCRLFFGAGKDEISNRAVALREQLDQGMDWPAGGVAFREDLLWERSLEEVRERMSRREAAASDEAWEEAGNDGVMEIAPDHGAGRPSDGSDTQSVPNERRIQSVPDEIEIPRVEIGTGEEE